MVTVADLAGRGRARVSGPLADLPGRYVARQMTLVLPEHRHLLATAPVRTPPG